jgi:hypothetical protein
MGRDARLHLGEGNPVRGVRLTDEDREDRMHDKMASLAADIRSLTEFEEVLARIAPEMREPVTGLLLTLIPAPIAAAWARAHAHDAPAVTVTVVPNDATPVQES